MSFDLHSRTVRIGGPDLATGCGYRDIVIHEMTEHEIDFLKSQRWMALALGVVIGFLIAGFVTAYNIMKYCA